MADFVSTNAIFQGEEKLLKGNELISIPCALKNVDVLALYFSAHWCGPCRRFTPILSKMYQELAFANKSFEIVFISSDSNLSEFNEYYEDMPWMAAPYSNRSLQALLSKKYGCDGIPYLVILDVKTGEEITRDGRDAVLQAGALGFPFDESSIKHAKDEKNKALLSVFMNWEIFGNEVNQADLKKKEAVAVLFGNSTSQTPLITQKLSEAYESLFDRLAVIYVPHHVGEIETETLFQSNLPQSWTKAQQCAYAVSSAVIAITGVISCPTLLVMSGDCSRLHSEDACRPVFYSAADGFPWSPESIEAAEEEAEEEVRRFRRNTIGCPGLKFLDAATLISHGEGGELSEHRAHESDARLHYLDSAARDHLFQFDLVGLYFSAHWCYPCRSFTPMVVEEYNLLKKAGKSVEIVFISSDSDDASFLEYFSCMPWVAMDFKHRKLQTLLSSAFEVNGIPSLIWVNPKTGEMIKDGRRTISMGAEWFPWTPELMALGENNIERRTAEKIEKAKRRATEVETAFRMANTVVVKNHKQLGEISPDYTLKFLSFNSFMVDIRLRNSKFYYEIEVKKIDSICQFGWMTEGFSETEEYDGLGVGDDEFSWGFDGVRQSKWGEGGDADFGSEWKEGDVLGCAADLTGEGGNCLYFSVNGSFAAPDGLAFSNIKADWLAPALTAQGGVYRLNMGDRPFCYRPPDDLYISVHSTLPFSNEEVCVGDVCIKA